MDTRKVLKEIGESLLGEEGEIMIRVRKGSESDGSNAPCGDPEARRMAQWYMEFLHTRLNHIQNLQTFVLGLVATLAAALFSAGAFALREYLDDPDLLLATVEPYILPAYATLAIILTWAQWISIYQTFCVGKLVVGLRHFETGVSSDYAYFKSRRGRVLAYLAMHMLPTLLLILIPVVLLYAKVFTVVQTLDALGITVLLPCVGGWLWLRWMFKPGSAAPTPG